MVSSFDPHSMCKNVERVTAKTWCISRTKRTISFEVSGFHTETRLLQRDFIFLNLFELHSFSMLKMHHSKPHHQFSTLSDIICYFRCIYWFVFRAKSPWKWKALQNERWKGWNLARYHHFTHIACARKYKGLRQKLDALRVQNSQSPSKYEGFIRKLVCYKGISFFKTYLNSWLFVCSKCTIQSHIIIFQSFLTSFVIFHAFTNYFEL